MNWILRILRAIPRGVASLFGRGDGGNTSQTIEAILSLLGLGGRAAGAGADENFRQWLQNAIATAILRGEDILSEGRNIMESPLAVLGDMGRYAPYLMDESLNAARGTRDMSQWFLQRTDDDLNRFLNISSPLYEAGYRQAVGAFPGIDQLSSVALQGFLGGGWTPMFDRSYQLGFGVVDDPFLSTLRGAGERILAGSGETPFTQAAELAAIRALTEASSALGPAQRSALEILLSGGETPLSRAMGDIGLSILSQDPLLGLTTAMQIAREQAAQQARRRMANVAAQAARLGGPGAVSAGVRLNPLAEFEDQAIADISRATLDAMGQQQALRANQWTKAADLAQAALGESARRLGLGFGFLPSAQQAAAQMINAAAGLGDVGIRSALSRLQLGSQLGMTPVETALSSLRTLAPIMGTQVGYATDLGRLGLSGYSTLANLGQGLAGLDLQRMGLGSEVFSRRGANIANLLGAYGSAARDLGNLGMGWALEPLYRQLGIGSDIYRTGAGGVLGPVSSAFGPLNRTSGWENFFYSLGNPQRRNV